MGSVPEHPTVIVPEAHIDAIGADRSVGGLCRLRLAQPGRMKHHGQELFYKRRLVESLTLCRLAHERLGTRSHPACDVSVRSHDGDAAPQEAPVTTEVFALFASILTKFLPWTPVDSRATGAAQVTPPDTTLR